MSLSSGKFVLKLVLQFFFQNSRLFRSGIKTTPRQPEVVIRVEIQRDGHHQQVETRSGGKIERDDGGDARQRHRIH